MDRKDSERRECPLQIVMLFSLLYSIVPFLDFLKSTCDNAFFWLFKKNLSPDLAFVFRVISKMLFYSFFKVSKIKVFISSLRYEIQLVSKFSLLNDCSSTIFSPRFSPFSQYASKEVLYGFYD